MTIAKYPNLRDRAKQVINKSQQQTKSVTALDLNKILAEFDIQQAALGIQNEELERIQAELDLTSKKYGELYENAPISYFTLNDKSMITDVNKMGIDLLGISKAFLVKRNFTRYVCPSNQLFFKKHVEAAITSMELQTCELNLLHKNKTIISAQISSKSILKHDENGKIVKELLMFVSDITARKQIEHWIREQQRKIFMINNTSIIDEIAAKLADDVNQPLAVVVNYINGCLLQLKSNNINYDSFTNALKKALESVYRTVEKVQSMKNFSVKRAINPTEVLLDAIIQEALTMLDFEAHDYPLKIYYDPVGEHVKVRADKIYIQQVILNIARNAIEAMRDTNTTRPRLMIEVDPLTDKFYKIVLHNNGPSLFQGEDKTECLFDQYTSTKSYGIGVGLSVSKTIIEAHGGTLEISDMGDNSTGFSFTLPRC